MTPLNVFAITVLTYLRAMIYCGVPGQKCHVVNLNSVNTVNTSQ